jgi:hypothetical protein
MKRDLLSHQFSDQFFDPINRDLIAYQEQYSLIPLDLCVEFDALIAHRTPFRTANRSNLMGRRILKALGWGIVHSET